MKIMSFVFMALGLAVVVLSIVCFISAGDIIEAAEMYTMLFGNVDIDHVKMLEMAMVEVDGFARFAYYSRVWLLIGGIVLLAVGAAFMFLGRSGNNRRAPNVRNAVPANRRVPAMTCPACGAQVESGSAFCMNCGSPMSVKPVSIKPVAVESIYCSECGAANEPGSKFCMGCGSPLGAAAPSPAPSGAHHVGSSTGTISATVVTGDAGTIRLDTSGYSTGTVRIAAGAPRAAAPAREPSVPVPEPAAPASTAAVDEYASSAGTVMINVKEKPAAKPASGKSRLMKAGDL